MSNPKCSRCHTYFVPELKSSGLPYMSCVKCREREKKRQECVHGNRKSRCKECGGSEVCEHDRLKSQCKDCGGAVICKHNKRRAYCRDCNGNQICEHDRERSKCKDCGGSQICEHNRQRSVCKDCQGSSICEHNKVKSVCKDCNGGSLCEHKIVRTRCRECGGGSFCEHDVIRSNCRDCEGGSVCEHKQIRSKCKECNFIGYLTNLVRSRICNALKCEKSMLSIEYLGCSIEEYKQHLENQFTPEMNWENYGVYWHVDHYTPLLYKNPTIEQVIDRLHWTNTQPMKASDNILKGNRFIG